MTAISRLAFCALAILWLFSCGPSDPPPINAFADPQRVRIADFKDRRLSDSLAAYLDNADPALRRYAAYAFGSVQDAEMVEPLGKRLLMDSDPSVRMAAAFALGQTTDISSERLLLAAVAKEKDAAVLSEVLVAYGKVTRRWDLDATSLMDDSLKTAGLAWSLYHAAIRKKTPVVLNATAASLLHLRHSAHTRLGAAHYFARGASQVTSQATALIHSAKHDPSASVRMAATAALGKVGTDSALATLKNLIKEARDSRIIVNGIRALKNYPYKRIKHYLYEALNHKDVSVGIAASEVIIETIDQDDWIEVSSLTSQVDNWRIRANVYEAALKAGQNADLAREVKERFSRTNDHFRKAALLGSLKHMPLEYQFVADIVDKADTAILRSAAAVALTGMNQSPNFDLKLTDRFAKVYESLLESSDDPAVLGTIAIALADSALHYRRHFKNTSAIRNARERLRLPEHIEAVTSLEAAIRLLENDNTTTSVANPFNHPIDWEFVKKIPHDQLATIKTSRGSIVIRLKVNDAPGSVANFIELARRDYFDNRFIHRVVPNFVIQDGCTRGDGWGSEAYSIRSEFSSDFYDTGSVGMASAGKDTESTQWFITHSPTPHLEGKYSLFADVIEGQAVVDFLQVGDQVFDVEVENFTDQ